MAPGGIEPTTFALLARRSNQLSYGATYEVKVYNKKTWPHSNNNVNIVHDTKVNPNIKWPKGSG
jgi:hypothetical protein